MGISVKKKGPRITKQRYTSRRQNFGHPMMEYDYTGCSECHKEVHPTAKSCPGCGAVFQGKPASLLNGKSFQIV